MVEEIEEIMDEEVTSFNLNIFTKKAAKLLYDYFYGAMAVAANRHPEKSTAFAIDVENNALDKETCPCATLYRKTPEWHEIVHNIGWSFGEIMTSYTDPETLVYRYDLRTLMDAVNNVYYNRSLSLNYELLCGSSGMTVLALELYDIFINNVSETGHIYEVEFREHSAYGGCISIIWKK